MKDSQQESHTEATPEEKVKTLDYFYNEQGDYTITLYDQPIAIARDKSQAIKLTNSFSALTMRIDVLVKTNQDYYKRLQKMKALTFDIR